MEPVHQEPDRIISGAKPFNHAKRNVGALQEYVAFRPTTVAVF